MKDTQTITELRTKIASDEEQIRGNNSAAAKLQLNGVCMANAKRTAQNLVDTLNEWEKSMEEKE